MKNVFFLFLFFAIISCNAQTDSLTKVNPGEFEKAIIGGNVQVLDVRTAGEFTSGHIRHALWADWNDKKQFNERIQYVDKDIPVYIYCLVGGRSAAAADWMRKNGFMNVTELQGGLNAWKTENKPLEGMGNEKQMTLEEYWARIPKDKTVLVDFGATWCPPCIKMEPVLGELQSIKGLNFLLVKVDGGIHTNVMKELIVESIPVFIIYKNGKESWRKAGIVSREELLEQLR